MSDDTPKTPADATKIITAAAAKAYVDGELDRIHRHFRELQERLLRLGYDPNSLLMQKARAAADAAFAVQCVFMDISVGGKNARRGLRKEAE